jgi:hypothetical protein
VVLGLLLLLVAHQFTHPKVIRMGVKEDQLLIAVNYDVNPGQDAVQLRSLFDRDADGSMSKEEQDKLTVYLEQMAMLYFELTIDGQKVKPSKISTMPFRIDAPATSSDTLGVALLYSAPLPKNDTIELSIADQTKSRETHVPLVVDLTDGWEVLFANQGEVHPTPFALHRVRLDRERPLSLRLRRAPTTVRGAP